MTEIIFQKKKINSANEFVNIFKETKNILVITGKNGCGKTRFFHYLQDFLSKTEQTERFYPILLQFGAEILKTQSKKFESFDPKGLESKFDQFLRNNIRDSTVNQREKLKKIKAFFVENNDELDKFKISLKENEVNYDEEIEETNDDEIGIKRSNFYFLDIICKYISDTEIIIGLNIN